MDILRTPITDATAWKAADVQADDSWKYRLTETDIAELDAALKGVEARGLGSGEFGKEDFPLPGLEAKLHDIDHQIREGRGFVLIKGFPVDDYSMDQVKAMYWGLGQYFGTVIPHNVKGDLMAPVVDQGLKADDPNRRNNTTNNPLDPHTDLADVVTLLCMEQAAEGGMSGLASAVQIHNEILANHPEYLEVLYRGFYHDFRGYGPTGDPNEVTATPIPVFEYHNGRVSMAFAKAIIERGAAKRGVPLTELEQAAIDYVHELALRDDMRADMMLEKGDIQMINNYITIHSRTNYIDHEDGRKRYLLRMWINQPDSVQLSEGFAALVRRGIPAQQKSEVSA